MKTSKSKHLDESELTDQILMQVAQHYCKEALLAPTNHNDCTLELTEYALFVPFFYKIIFASFEPVSVM